MLSWRLVNHQMKYVPRRAQRPLSGTTSNLRFSGTGDSTNCQSCQNGDLILHKEIQMEHSKNLQFECQKLEIKKSAK